MNLISFTPTCILFREKIYSNASEYRIEFYMCSLQRFKVVALSFNSNQWENYFKSIVKELTLSKFCTILSLFNFEPTR